MKIKRRVLGFWTCFCLGSLAVPGVQASPLQAVPAVETLSLEQVLQRVYADNPGLWILRQERQIWAARILQAGLGANPELSLVNEDFAGSAAFTPDRFTQFSLGLAQNLVLNQKLEDRRHLAELQAQVAHWGYSLQLQYLGRDTHKACIQLLNLQAEAQLLAQLASNAQTQLQWFEKSAAAGKLAPVAVLQAQNQLKTLESEQLQLRLDIQTQKQALTALWGGIEGDFELQAFEVASDTPLNLGLLQQKLAQHPQLARWGIESQAREMELQSAQSQAMPDLNLGGGLRYHPPQDWGLVLSVNLPLPVWNQHQGIIAEARLKHARWQQERDRDVRALALELKRAWSQVEGQAALVAVLKGQLQLGQEQKALAEKAFALGKSTALEILLASQNLAQIQRRHLQAQGHFRLAQIEVLALTQPLFPPAWEKEEPIGHAAPD